MGLAKDINEEDGTRRKDFDLEKEVMLIELEERFIYCLRCTLQILYAACCLVVSYMNFLSQQFGLQGLIDEKGRVAIMQHKTEQLCSI